VINEKGLTLNEKQRSMIMLPLLIGGFIALLNETILNVAYPQLISTLNVSINTIQWLNTTYMLVIGVLIPVFAFLLRTFSIRKLYLTSMAFFIIGTIGCGFSQSFPLLLFFRIVQAGGTGMLMPIMTNTIIEIYPPARRGAAIGLSLMIVVAAPAIGPAASGLILQYLDWHWLFFLSLPIAALAIILGTYSLKNVFALTKPKIDILSVILSFIGFGGLIFGGCSIETLGILNVVTIVPLVCGIAGLILFVIRQLTLKQPILELRTFRYPMFSLGVAIIFLTMLTVIAVNVILPTYIQNVMGLSSFIAGLALLPCGIIAGGLAPVAGRLFDKIGARFLVTAGFVVTIISLFFLSHTSVSTNLLTMISLYCGVAFGTVLIFTPTQTNALNQLPREQNPHGVAILTTALQIASAFSTAIFISLVGTGQANYLKNIDNPTTLQQHQALVSGLDISYTAAIFVVLIGLFLSFFLKRPKQIQEYPQEIAPQNN
jgi:MFS transporter, DHA2 family, lincomycin resistance protein